MTGKNSKLRINIIIASLILVAALAFALANNTGYIAGEPDEISKRVMGAVFGALLVLFANRAPKNLPPWSDAARDPARRQTLQRFAGWALVLSGLGYSVVWLAAPIAAAAPLSITLVGSALLLVLIRCFLPKFRGDRN